MINASDLCTKFRQALAEKWGYIWGGAGQTWTQAKQDAATRDMTKRYGARWIGRRVADCSGLFVWAFRELGGSIYHGSNTIWRSYCASKGELANGKRADGLPMKPGTAVFLYRASDNNRHHIGLYVGNDTVIEAKGTAYGVVTSRLSHWHEWGELKDVDYGSGMNTNKASETDGNKTAETDGNDASQKGGNPVETLRRGMSGSPVARLQTMLTQLGYDPGVADGIFGTKTYEAVCEFQGNNGLETDGIVGAKTQDKLIAAIAQADAEGGNHAGAAARLDIVLAQINALLPRIEVLLTHLEHEQKTGDDQQ